MGYFTLIGMVVFGRIGAQKTNGNIAVGVTGVTVVIVAINHFHIGIVFVTDSGMLIKGRTDARRRYVHIAYNQIGPKAYINLP